MGSCVSVGRGSWSAIKPSHSPESKTENLVILPSPVKNGRPLAGEPPIKTVYVKSDKSPFGSAYNYVDYGSKDEVFFDSQVWLDSDCEDDFFSVNGDFTPSRGNTPVHHKFSPGINGVSKTHIEDQNQGSTSEPSPTGKRKRLSELFTESFKNNLEDDDEEDQNEPRPEKITQVKPVDHDLLHLPKFQNSTPRVSADGEALEMEQKTIRSAQCCLPSLAVYRGFSERRRTTMSPSMAVHV